MNCLLKISIWWIKKNLFICVHNNCLGIPQQEPILWCFLQKQIGKLGNFRHLFLIKAIKLSKTVGHFCAVNISNVFFLRIAIAERNRIIPNFTVVRKWTQRFTLMLILLALDVLVYTYRKTLLDFVSNFLVTKKGRNSVFLEHV